MRVPAAIAMAAKATPDAAQHLFAMLPAQDVPRRARLDRFSARAMRSDRLFASSQGGPRCARRPWRVEWRFDDQIHWLLLNSTKPRTKVTNFRILCGKPPTNSAPQIQDSVGHRT